MVHLLLFEHGGGEDDALAALLDAGAQKQSAEVLFDRARADVQFRGDFLVAATLYQQLEDFVVATSNFDLIEA